MKKIEELNSMLFDVKNTLDTAVLQLEDFDAKNLWLNRKLKEEVKAIKGIIEEFEILQDMYDFVDNWQYGNIRTFNTRQI